VGLSDHRSHARSVLLEFESFEKVYRLSIGACVLQITTDVAKFIAEAIHHIM
jgi:nucleotidyltransferase/DNA polymerase involved in DNA repair